MLKGNYEVEVLVNGNPVREYVHKGKFYIEGRKEVPYRIKVRNNGHSRIKAVISVDGLSVLSGEEATLLGRGYIINGYDSLVVEGWRKNDNNVAEFYFSDRENSYSVRSGNGRENIGVIGVSIVEEETIYNNYKIKHIDGGTTTTVTPFYGQINNSSHSTPSIELNSMTCSNNVSMCNVNTIGTGWGKELNSSVTSVSFNSKGYPS